MTALAFGALAAGCAIDASEPSTSHQEQAVVTANTAATVQAAAPAGPQLARVHDVVSAGHVDERPVVVLSAPVTTNGGGVGQGSDEGPRPNPWTPPPETKSDDGSEGPTGGTGGTGTGTNAPDVDGAGGSKSAPTK